MEKDKKKLAEWVVFLQGSLVSLWMYLMGAFVVALFLAKGILPEGAMFPMLAGLCVAASLLGGMLTSGKSTLGALPASVLNAVIFAFILALAGSVCWYEVSWRGHGGILLICVLAGGILAGLLVKPKGRRKKKGKSYVMRR